MPVSFSDVRAAAAGLHGRIIRTPVVRHDAMDRATGCQVWLKCESLQHIGAFKARGALHALSQLTPEARGRGVLTYSSGNHAQAVALAAHAFGVSATIAMPTDAPSIKVQGVRELGARIEFAGTTSEDRKRRALELAAESGATIIEPFDSADIIAGQGTAALELMLELQARGETLDALVVPVGGGGVLAGSCVVAQHFGVPVISVEPVGCDSMAKSLKAGERVGVSPAPTIADGLKPVMVGVKNFEIARHVVRICSTVDDTQLRRAVAGLALRCKLVVEPSGAAGLATLLDGRLNNAIASLRGGSSAGSPLRIGVIVTGGNIEPTRLVECLDQGASSWT